MIYSQDEKNKEKNEQAQKEKTSRFFANHRLMPSCKVSVLLVEKSTGTTGRTEYWVSFRDIRRDTGTLKNPKTFQKFKQIKFNDFS